MGQREVTRVMKRQSEGSLQWGNELYIWRSTSWLRHCMTILQDVIHWGKVSKWYVGIFLYNFLQMHENPQYDDNSSLTKRKKNRVEPSSRWSGPEYWSTHCLEILVVDQSPPRSPLGMSSLPLWRHAPNAASTRGGSGVPRQQWRNSQTGGNAYRKQEPEAKRNPRCNGGPISEILIKQRVCSRLDAPNSADW